MADTPSEKPFAALDSRAPIALSDKEVQPALTSSLEDADEALAFLENHPEAALIAEEGRAILEDEKRRKKLLRKIDYTIAPLIAATYFMQYLDKNTLSYASVMGFIEDTDLHGQDYSILGLLFYAGE